MILDHRIATSLIPSAEPVGTSGYLRRAWVVKVRQPVNQVDLDRLLITVLGQCQQEAAEATGRPITQGSQLLGTAVTAYHVVLATDFPSHSIAKGDEAAIYNWGALRKVDGSLGIEELQGLPRSLWWFLDLDVPAV